MTYKEVGFRAVYHRFCVVEINDEIRPLMGSLPGGEEANCVLGYG